MDSEVNIDSIQALEKLIEEGHGDVIRPKRVRNSLLNIQREYFPKSLHWEEYHSLLTDLCSDGLRRGSCNLLVCHH